MRAGGPGTFGGGPARACGISPGVKGRPGGGLAIAGMLGGGGGRDTVLRCGGTPGSAGRLLTALITLDVLIRVWRPPGMSGKAGSGGKLWNCVCSVPGGGACGGAGSVPIGTSARADVARSSRAVRRRVPSGPWGSSEERPRLERFGDCGGWPGAPASADQVPPLCKNKVWGAAGRAGMPPGTCAGPPPFLYNDICLKRT